MAIYVFSLMVNYTESGIDMAQGLRSDFLRKKQPVYYIFYDLPGERELLLYEKLGIQKREMLSVHLFFTGNYDFSEEYPVSEHLDEIMERLQATEKLEREEEILLYRENSRIASLILSDNRKNIRRVDYYEKECLLLREYYAGRVLYREYYATAGENGCFYAVRERISFLDKKGNTVYDCLYEENQEETYVFPQGDTYTRYQFMEKFMQKLELTENDMILVDRPSYLDFVQPMFRYKGNARTVMFLHAGHFFEEEESISSLGLSIDYYYWFRNSNAIHSMLVSTEEQKKELKECLERFQCTVPEIEVVPAAYLQKLRYPEKERTKHSLLTVSRLVYNKRVEWIIAAAILAHEQVPDITLDIYGEGAAEYIRLLRQKIEEADAASYIRLHGYCDVQEIYKTHEIYISASVRETLGLSVMEAVGSGNAVIGLNVKYGNRLFVTPGQNGILLDFCAADSHKEEKTNQLIKHMAEAIVDLCQDAEKRKRYQKNSYLAAEPFLKENVRQQWEKVLNTCLEEHSK